MECPLCKLPLRDPQTFYVCATNAKTKGFGEHTVHRAIAFPSLCCYSCFRAMLWRDRLKEAFMVVGLIAFAAMLLLFTYADEWFTPRRVQAAVGLIAICVVASFVLMSRKARRVGDPKTERAAIRIAHNLDLKGNPLVYPMARRPTARHFVVLDPDTTDGM